MKKVFALMVVSLFLVGLAFATETRIEGLGIQTWQTLDDDAIVFDYVGQLSNFKNIAVVEQTSPSTGLGGVILGLDGMSLGAFVGKKSIMLGEALTGTDDMFPITIPVPLASVNSKNINNVAEELLAMPVIPINLLYSIDMSDMSIGFGLGYASSGTSWEEKTPDTAKDKYSANAREISALLGLTMGSIDAGLKLAIPSVSIALDDQVYVGGASQASRDNKWDVSGMAVNLLGRINLGEALLANLAIGYVSGSGKLAIKADGNNDGKFDNAADTNKESSGEGSNISVELGVSKEIKAQTAKAICGVVLGYSSQTEKGGIIKAIITPANDTKGTEASTSVISLAANLGAEAKLNDTFSMRGGISKKLVSMETTTTKNLDLDPVSENAESSDDTGSPVVTLGASATIGSFTLDAVVSQEILLTGPDFIGGNPAALNSKIAAKYVW